MGATPQGEDITIEFECQFRIDLQTAIFHRCGSKQYITRMLLGMEQKKRVPDETRRKLALMGALTSYRVSAKIGKMFGWAVDKMTIWKLVQQ
jgi:hypothetical protein